MSVQTSERPVGRGALGAANSDGTTEVCVMTARGITRRRSR